MSETSTHPLRLLKSLKDVVAKVAKRDRTRSLSENKHFKIQLVAIERNY
jgi:hypothetical protein